MTGSMGELCIPSISQLSPRYPHPTRPNRYNTWKAGKYGELQHIKKTSWFYTFKNWYLGGPFFFFNILLFESSPIRPGAGPVLPAPADHVETDLVRTRGANIREAGVPGRPGIWDGDGSSQFPENYWKLTWKPNLMGSWWLFPECVARVPVSLWGSGGWGCVRSTLRSRAQPSATVRNRSQPFATVRARTIWPCLWEVLQRWSFLEVSERVVASFRVAGVALRDIQTCFATCWKSFCVAGAVLLCRFQKMCCSFRGRRSTLDVSSVIFRGRRSTLDASCGVFFVKPHWQGCVKWWQGANSVAGVAFSDMCWKLTEASHETSILRLPIFGF